MSFHLFEKSGNIIGGSDQLTDLLKEMCALKNRSSCPDVFCKKGVLKNFAKFTGKHVSEPHFKKSCRPEATF